MPDQDKIDNVTEEIFSIIDKAKTEVVQDLLKLKNQVSEDEYIQAINTIDLKDFDADKYLESLKSH